MGESASLSYYLSVFTIAACCVLKVPQIINVCQKESAVGININALLLELGSYTLTALYNAINGYSIMTYMEYPIILIQQMALIFIVLKYKNQHTSPEVRYAVICYFCTSLAFLCRAIPTKVLTILMPLTTPVSGMSKIVYIYGMINEESAETTSLTTWVISIATNLSRFYTVAVDSGDKTLLFNFFISTLMSTAVLATALKYKKRDNRRQQRRYEE